MALDRIERLPVLGLAIAAVLLVGGNQADARPRYYKAFIEKYPTLKAQVGRIKCKVCHVGRSKKNRNEYGKALTGPLLKRNQKTAEIIDAALTEASAAKNSHGVTFGSLINASKLPGTAVIPVRPTRSSKLTIPVGKFRLELKNGTQIVGVPSKTWSATLMTRFGKVTIPRDQISRIETMAGEVRVYLNSGDRVSGSLLSGTMKFVTQFGHLSVPISELVHLHSRGTVSTSVIRIPVTKNRMPPRSAPRPGYFDGRPTINLPSPRLAR